jgi:hypothetical protein
MWTNSLSSVFGQILGLCQQYMPERVVAMTIGSDDLEPIHMTRDEIQGKYSIVCRGNDNNTNPYVKAQKSQMRVQLLLSNPLMLQTGVITPPNIYNILKRYLQDDGEIAWKELISMPQPPQPPQPPPAATLIKPDYKDLTDAEQAQVLQSAGVQPDPVGRAMERREEMREDEFEGDMNVHQKNMDIAKLIMEGRNADQKAALEKEKIRASREKASAPRPPRPSRP